MPDIRPRGADYAISDQRGNRCCLQLYNNGKHVHTFHDSSTAFAKSIGQGWQVGWTLSETKRQHDKAVQTWRDGVL